MPVQSLPDSLIDEVVKQSRQRRTRALAGIAEAASNFNREERSMKAIIINIFTGKARSVEQVPAGYCIELRDYDVTAENADKWQYDVQIKRHYTSSRLFANPAAQATAGQSFIPAQVLLNQAEMEADLREARRCALIILLLLVSFAGAMGMLGYRVMHGQLAAAPQCLHFKDGVAICQ